MLMPTSILALTQLLAAIFAPSPSTPIDTRSPSINSSTASITHPVSFPSPSMRPKWSGELPPIDDVNKPTSIISSCTFAIGPPNIPAFALCPAFTSHCTTFRDDLNSHRIRTLKTSPPFSPIQSRKPPRGIRYDDDNPLKHVKFRTGCTGGATTASDGSHLSSYTATCIVDGVDWVPFVFDSFLREEFPVDGPLPIQYSLIGCQIPSHL